MGLYNNNNYYIYMYYVYIIYDAYRACQKFYEECVDFWQPGLKCLGGTPKTLATFIDMWSSSIACIGCQEFLMFQSEIYG